MNLPAAHAAPLLRRLLLASGLFAAGAWLVVRAETEYVAAQAEFAAQRQRQAQADAAIGKAEERRRLAERIGELRRQGLIGEEARTDWTRLLAGLARDPRLAASRHAFTPATAPEQDIGDGYAFRVSDLRWRARLAHEIALFDVIDTLNAQTDAVVRVRSCRLERLDAPPQIDTHPLHPLAADCRFEWITIRPPQASR